ncbi:calcium-binding protein [Oscillatoria sp. CS-180]|uniref:calcium-binding protein n=1 Tax=Oscillatoria sp. CS-180 TaxID=3021720 RepID=UPI00233030B9|nr:calcium-binding protein [Oscillatoria sp. CS-180]MDB9529784.1 calcium-binding protein [Oscillatoria sp. CS-180]
MDADPEREQRIDGEIIVDAYSSEEVAMGWYYYLEKTLQFPFSAIWLTSNRRGSQREGPTVQVVWTLDNQGD